MADGSVKLFLSVLENPLLRFVIRFSSMDRSKCGKSYLEIALDDYAGDQGSSHSPASTVTSWIVSLAIDLGCKAFGVDRNQAREALRVPYFKKGLVNILDGIGRYSVTSPQRLAAPFLVVWNYYIKRLFDVLFFFF